MTEIQERRAEGAGRVRVETLVEVCGNQPGIPAFEAEAVDVSARGMHLRTAYLPDNGAPLICRFEEGGREIVVEGRVAWRREGARGGEFGVEFTALDSGSVGALRELCDGAGEQGTVQEPIHDAKSEIGSRVRLHIDGLGSPMKARVRETSAANVQVGSNLEFLKVGRKLELEDLEAGGRRHAQIDGVSVAIDPITRVPQLVVQLRFAGVEDTTPEPSVASLHFGEREPKGFKIPASSVTTDAAVKARDNSADNGAEYEDDDDDAEAAALRGKIGEAAANAGEAVQTAGAAVARFSARAAHGMGGLFKGAGLKVLALSKRAEPAPQRRTTAPAPHGNKSVEGPRLRPQSSASVNANASEETAPAAVKPMRKKVMLGAAGVVLLASLAAAATHFGGSNAPPGAHASQTPAVTALPPSTGAPLSATPTNLGPATSTIASANIPLFGPTPMATMEPAPLAPPPGSPEAVEAQERADAKSNLSGTPISNAAADEAFSDESSDDDKADSKSSKDDKKGKKETDTTPWGHGKLRSPTIYRIRLDDQGGKLQGALLPTGFTVLVPGHKVMESGSGIAKRDNRISNVRTSNRTEGAEVSFRFRDSIPAYRVRLRRDYMEILIGEGDAKESKESKDSKDSKDSKNSKSSRSDKADKSDKADSKVASHSKSHRD
ncbi:MAG TPA: PilZ domain-containing protein [Polyangiaceae bacterium]|nr:PilZ domain-containing protein [Polyangiaceae bacterium]